MGYEEDNISVTYCIDKEKCHFCGGIDSLDLDLSTPLCLSDAENETVTFICWGK